MKKGNIIAIILFLGISFPSLAQTTDGEIMGRIWDIDSIETAPSVNVYIEIAGSKKGVLTDIDGKFRISSVPTGVYTLTALQMNGKRVFHNVTVKPDQITNLGSFKLADSSMIKTVVVSSFREPLIAEEPARINISYDEIQVSAVRSSPLKLAATSGGAQLTADGSGLIIRGSRPESTIYYIDGVKQTSMATVPSAAIGSMSVYTGGVPAKYGDCTGGVVVLETVSYFDLYNRWKSSQFK